MIRCVVFDFDGTLVMSNDIKRQGFLEVAGGFDKGPERMKAILAAPRGDRAAILRCFAEEIGAQAEVEDLVYRYTAWCEERILFCPERPGAAQALGRLRRAGLRIHLNSATPTEALQSLVDRRYAPGTFDGVHGGHGVKVGNLRAIQAAEGVQAKEVAMVGDGVDDRAAAEELGCVFVGVNQGTLSHESGCGRLLDDLGGLHAVLGLCDAVGREGGSEPFRRL